MSVEVLGVLASIAFFARLTPQPIRLWRTGVPDGVSPMAAMNAALSDIGWILYGLAAGLVPVWLTAVVALVPGVWTVWLLRREATRRDLLWSCVWLATIGLAWASGTLVAILGVSVIVNQGPQVARALRERDLRGVSPTTYVLALADAGLWGAYGVAADDVAVMGYAVVLFAAAVTVLTRIWWTRRSATSRLGVGPELAADAATA